VGENSEWEDKESLEELNLETDYKFESFDDSNPGVSDSSEESAHKSNYRPSSSGGFPYTIDWAIRRCVTEFHPLCL
jgi:hypothetical protein